MDFFGPTEAVVWHQYTKAVRLLHWEDAPRWHETDAVSLTRMRHILGMTPDTPIDVSLFGVGSVRTLEQYQRMAGIDFRAHTTEPHALAGEF